MTPRDMAIEPQEKRKGKLKRGRGASSANSTRRQNKKKKEDHDSETENGEIKCSCGKTHDDGFSIQCERCFFWQHFVCYGITDANVPDRHVCDMCEPRNRKLIPSNFSPHTNPSLSSGTSPSHPGQISRNGSNSNMKPTSRTPSRSKLESESDSDSSHTPDTDEINKNPDNDSPLEETIYVNNNETPKKGRQPRTLKEKRKSHVQLTINHSYPPNQNTKHEDSKKKIDIESLDTEQKRDRSESPEDLESQKHNSAVKTPSLSLSITQPKTSPTLLPLIEKLNDHSAPTTPSGKSHLGLYGKKYWAKQYKEELESTTNAPNTPTFSTTNQPNSNSTSPTIIQNSNLSISNTTPTTPLTQNKVFPKKKQIVQIEKLKEAKSETHEKSIQELVAYADSIVPKSSSPILPHANSPTLVKIEKSIEHLSSIKNTATVPLTPTATPTSTLSIVKDELKEDSKMLQSPDSSISKTKFSLKDYQKQKQTEPKVLVSNQNISPIIPAAIATTPLVPNVKIEELSPSRWNKDSSTLAIKTNGPLHVEHDFEPISPTHDTEVAAI